MHPLLKFGLFYIAMCLGFFVVLIFLHRGLEGIEWGQYIAVFLGAPLFLGVFALLARKSGAAHSPKSDGTK